MSEVKEIQALLKRVKRSIGREPKKYLPEDQKASKRGRKRKYESKAEKQRAYRERKKVAPFSFS